MWYSNNDFFYYIKRKLRQVYNIFLFQSTLQLKKCALLDMFELYYVRATGNDSLIFNTWWVRLSLVLFVQYVVKQTPLGHTDLFIYFQLYPGHQVRERVVKAGFMTCALYSWLLCCLSSSRQADECWYLKSCWEPDSFTTKRTAQQILCPQIKLVSFWCLCLS